MHELTITTSWDDGDVHCERLADLLDRHGLAGTFYVSRVSPEAPRLPEAAIRRLSGRHEIGGHTLRHVRLDWVTGREARDEIEGSRAWLADVTGIPPTSFCYPWGKWTPRVVETARETGFTYGRTIEHLSMRPPGDRLLDGTTSQTLPQVYYLPRLLRLGDLRLLAAARTRETFLVEAARCAHDRGRPFHLWGHAWEVERFGQWDLLDRLFSELAARWRLRPVQNGALGTPSP